MNYTRERAMHEQECMEEMIRMREPVCQSTGPHPDEMLDVVAMAIWTANGGVPRLLTEICRAGSMLAEQQSKCMKQARAVVAALRTPTRRTR